MKIFSGPSQLFFLNCCNFSTRSYKKWIGANENQSTKNTPGMENQRPTPQNNQPQSGIRHFQVPSPQFGRPVFFGDNPNHFLGEDIGLTIFWVDCSIFLLVTSFLGILPSEGLFEGLLATLTSTSSELDTLRIGQGFRCS